MRVNCIHNLEVKLDKLDPIYRVEQVGKVNTWMKLVDSFVKNEIPADMKAEYAEVRAYAVTEGAM